ncbi:endonuclease reverse transcriptase, partial [Pelobates cultripes]
EVSDFTVWSAHMAVIRGQIIRHSTYLKKHHQTSLLECLKQIALTTAQNKQMPTPALASKLKALHQDLTTLNAQKPTYFLHRLRSTTYHNSGKASKYLANRLRTKQAATRIPHLFDQSGNKIMNPIDIVQEFAQFYKQLYNLKESEGRETPEPKSVQNHLQGINLPKISRDGVNTLCQPSTLQEVTAVIKNIHPGKSPGADGFSNAYYKTFADMLAPNLLKVYQRASEVGYPPPEMLLATIVTLPKPDKTTDNCGAGANANASLPITSSQSGIT